MSLSIPISCSLQRSRVWPVRKGEQLFEITLIEMTFQNCRFAYLRKFVFLLQLFQPPLQVSIRPSISFYYRIQCTVALLFRTIRTRLATLLASGGNCTFAPLVRPEYLPKLQQQTKLFLV